MDNSDQITEKLKDSVYTKLADAMLTGMEAGLMSDDESQTSAQYILSQLDLITTKEDLMVFLKNVSSQWPVYQNVYIELQEEESKKSDADKISQAQKQLKTIQ